MDTCVNGRKITGGPAKETAEAAIKAAREFISNI